VRRLSSRMTSHNISIPPLSQPYQPKSLITLRTQTQYRDLLYSFEWTRTSTTIRADTLRRTVRGVAPDPIVLLSEYLTQTTVCDGARTNFNGSPPRLAYCGCDRRAGGSDVMGKGLAGYYPRPRANLLKIAPPPVGDTTAIPPPGSRQAPANSYQAIGPQPVAAVPLRV